jgi:N-acetylneuraminate synthase/N,N'-diacetyllegionaminate synthase
MLQKVKVMVLSIDNKVIGPGHRPYIIAEIGINHGGDLDLAKKLITSASKAGADAVKLQAFKADHFLSRSSEYFDVFQNCELDESEFIELSKTAKEVNITLFATVFDFVSAEIIRQIDPPVYKIASSDLNHLPLIRHVASFGKPILLSTGAGTMDEIWDAVGAIKRVNANTAIGLFHCVSNYPTYPTDANLACMATMRDTFELPVGFSDHTLGNDTCIAATALGASILEKHFTLNQNMKGPDHALSANPNEFEALVVSVRNAFEALGCANKKPIENEHFIKAIRRSLTAAKPIKAGTKIHEDMLTFKRPGFGIPPDKLLSVIDMTAMRNIEKDEALFWDDLGQ